MLFTNEITDFTSLSSLFASFNDQAGTEALSWFDKRRQTDDD